MIKLSRSSQQKLGKNKYKFVQTTFITRDGGPAKATIWFNKAEPKAEPRIVSFVQREKKPHLTWVSYRDGGHETLDHFLTMCDIGQYVLIGVIPLAISHTEI